MKLRLPSYVAPVLTIAIASSVYGAEAPAPPNFKPVLGAKSVTVFPIVLSAGQPVPASLAKTCTEVVGTFLERAGMQEIEIADAQFSPSPKDDLDKMAQAFGQFVQAGKVATQYALFGQFIGSPGSGASEIRLVVTDRQGQVVLAQRFGREQLAATGKAKIDPMIACLFLVNSLREPWGLADPMREDAPEDKMAARLNKASGVPPKSALEAMPSRVNELKKKIKTSAVAVFPVGVSAKSDEKAAVRLAEMLTQEGFGRAQPVSADPKLDIQPSTNQMKILWDTARAFRDFLRKNRPAADYALLAAYGIGRTPDGTTKVGGVNFIVCDRTGEWVLVDLQNDHHPDFQRINPQSVEDCNHLVVERLKSNLQ